MAYLTHYSYISPGPAGPFKGKVETEERYSVGDEIYCPFGRARVTSCRKIKARDDMDRLVTDQIGIQRFVLDLGAIRESRQILKAMSLEDLRNMPYAFIKSLLHHDGDLDAGDLFHATERILQEANRENN